MTRPELALRATTALCLLLAGLCACTKDGPLTGQRMLDDLSRQRIPVPDEHGHAEQIVPAHGLPADGPLTLIALLDAAEADNPDLAAARSEVGIAAGQAWQAALYPNPRVDVSVEDVSWRDGSSESKTTVGLTQPFIIGDRRQAAVDAAKAEQAARLADVEARRRSLFGDIAILHAGLLANLEQQRLYGELRSLIERTIATAQTRFEARAAPETDVIRPRVELYRIDAALGRLRQERAASAKRLGLLVGGPTVDASRLEGVIQDSPAPLEADRLAAMMLASHPALAVADLEIDAAAARLARVEAEKTPDLDVRIAAGYDGQIDDGIVEFGAGMVVPLSDNREGDTLSARFELMRTRQQRLAIENDLQGRLAAALGEHESARTQLETFRERLVPEAQRAFDLTAEGYKAGRASFLDLLDAQRTLTESRITLMELAGLTAEARGRVIQIVGPNGLEGSRASSERPTVSQSNPEQRPKGAEVNP